MTNNAVNLGYELTRLLTYLLTRLEKYFGYTPPPLPAPEAYLNSSKRQFSTQLNLIH